MKFALYNLNEISMYLKTCFPVTYVYSHNWKLESNLSKLSEVAREDMQEEGKNYICVQRALVYKLWKVIILFSSILLQKMLYMRTYF